MANLKLKPSSIAKVKMVNQENATTSSNNPVGWWKMDEGTGTTTADSSGNGNTGTLTNGPTWTTGKLGKGLSFNGVDDYVSVGTYTKPSIFTISVWVNFASYTQSIYSGIVWSGDGNTAWGIAANGNNSKVSMRVSTGLNNQLWGMETLNATNYPVGWHNLVIMGNGSTLSYYKNGNFVTSTAQTIANSGTSSLSIGRWGIYAGANSYFNGLIDDVRIFARALSASEIAQLYNSTKDGYLGKIKMKP